mmetsp:Transcript_62300/g.184335  ORF Transcript_62300/g.184335 Transcript_62300/m.184335 type:complete len:96 (+) Transcript_62300:1208-1495(+)
MSPWSGGDDDDASSAEARTIRDADVGRWGDGHEGSPNAAKRARDRRGRGAEGKRRGRTPLRRGDPGLRRNRGSMVNTVVTGAGFISFYGSRATGY